MVGDSSRDRQIHPGVSQKGRLSLELGQKLMSRRIWSRHLLLTPFHHAPRQSDKPLTTPCFASDNCPPTSKLPSTQAGSEGLAQSRVLWARLFRYVIRSRFFVKKYSGKALGVKRRIIAGYCVRDMAPHRGNLSSGRACMR